VRRAHAHLYQVVAYVASARVRSEHAEEPIELYRRMEDFVRALGDDALLNFALTYQGDMWRRKGDFARVYVGAGKTREADPALRTAEALALQIGEANASTGGRSWRSARRWKATSATAEHVAPVGARRRHLSEAIGPTFRSREARPRSLC
jgi:hypothetical protein